MSERPQYVSRAELEAEGWLDNLAPDRTARQLVEQALHLRMYGERAPGGDETWADWDRRAETWLRATYPTLEET